MPDLSVLIPARNEMFLRRTIKDILENMEGDTEVIAVCDGNWPDPPIKDHPRVHLIYHSQSIGQRAAVNEAAKLSTAEFVMKCDAHCAFDKGFDVKLMADCEPDWTVVPRMYNLHAFDWRCKKCGHRWYQRSPPAGCEKCDNTADFERVIVWKPKKSPETDFMRFDSDLIFRYWPRYKRRPEAQGDICDLMSCLGACFFMRRDRFWEMGGLDEGHGGWGQMGTEVACKSWLSGGRMVVNKKTWFAHMFRGASFGFPYRLSGEAVRKARRYSRDLWFNNKWPRAKHDLKWLIDKFAPVPDWIFDEGPTKGVLYYTDNRLDGKIMASCQRQLEKCVSGNGLVSVSLQPIDFGRNIHLPLERGHLTMFKQILAGLEAMDADIVFFCEHDVLYHPSHFYFVPPRRDVFYYNVNVWKLRAEDGHALRVDDCKQTSGLCAYRDLLLEHYRKRVEIVERDGFTQRMGFEPGTHGRDERVDDYKAESWESEFPNIDIRHGKNLTPSRWSKEEFRNQRFTEGWTESDEMPGWGKTEDILRI